MAVRSFKKFYSLNLIRLLTGSWVKDLVLALAFIAVVLFNLGCGSNSPTFSVLPDSDTFQQKNEKLSSKLDVLWVIDNSGSMSSSQDNLTANFLSFIQDIDSRGFDYRIAVTTTDAYESKFSGDPNDSLFRDGTDATAHSGVFVITPQTPDVISTFVINAVQGINGDGDERAFSSMVETLKNPNNPDFLREDSFLSIIIVSDEDDFSHPGAWFDLDYDNPDIYSIDYFTDFLDDLTDSNEDQRRYSVSAMAIFDEPCRDELNDTFTGRRIGLRYEALVEATDGLKGSLCEDFAETLQAISENILILATQFYLTRIPIPETIKIYVDDKLVPEADLSLGASADGWVYDSDANSISFRGDSIPSAGAAIRVDFDPVGLDF